MFLISSNATADMPAISAIGEDEYGAAGIYAVFLSAALLSQGTPYSNHNDSCIATCALMPHVFGRLAELQVYAAETGLDIEITGAEYGN